jgi:hypothetical protein
MEARGDRMWDVIVVDPGNCHAGLHSDVLGSEGEVVDFHLRIYGLR